MTDSDPYWSKDSFAEAVTELMPSGFFKTGLCWEEAYLTLLELIKIHRDQLKEICLRRQPDNIFLRMYND